MGGGAAPGSGRMTYWGLVVTKLREETLGDLIKTIRSMAELTPEGLELRRKDVFHQDQAARVAAIAREVAETATEVAGLATAGDLRATVHGLRKLGYEDLAASIEEDHSDDEVS